MYTPYADTDNSAAAPAPVRQNPMFAVLGSPPYRLLWTAQFVSGLAGFFNYVAIAWLTLLLTGSNLAVGTVLAAAAVPLAVFMLVGGAVSDRFSPRNTMLAAGVVRGAVMAALALLALTHAIQFWQLLAGAVLVGTTSAFYYPASTSILPRLIDRSQFEAGNALLNLSRTAAVVLGPAIAGVVVATVGAGWALAADATASVVSAMLVIPLPAGAGGPSKSSNNPLADVRDGAVHVWRDVPLRAVLLVIAVLNFFALGAINVGLPALAHQRFPQGAVALGTAFGAWGVGSTIGSLLSATRPAPARFGPFVVAVVVFFGAGIAAMGLSPNLPVLLAVMVVVGVIEGASTTYLISWMQRRTDPGVQGRVMALAMLSSVGLQPVALALAGALASSHLSLLFWVSAGAVVLTAAGAALTRSVREM